MKQMNIDPNTPVTEFTMIQEMTFLKFVQYSILLGIINLVLLLGVLDPLANHVGTKACKSIDSTYEYNDRLYACYKIENDSIVLKKLWGEE